MRIFVIKVRMLDRARHEVPAVIPIMVLAPNVVDFPKLVLAHVHPADGILNLLIGAGRNA